MQTLPIAVKAEVLERCIMVENVLSDGYVLPCAGGDFYIPPRFRSPSSVLLCFNCFSQKNNFQNDLRQRCFQFFFINHNIIYNKALQTTEEDISNLADKKNPITRETES